MALVPFDLLSDDVLLHLLVKGGLDCAVQATKLDRRMKELCYAELKRRLDQVKFLTQGPFRIGRMQTLLVLFGIAGSDRTELGLGYRHIGDEGMKTLSSALSSGGGPGIPQCTITPDQSDWG